MSSVILLALAFAFAAGVAGGQIPARSVVGPLWYYRALVEAYRAHGTSQLSDGLNHTASVTERLSNR
jgi:hypothetical protein